MISISTQTGDANGHLMLRPSPDIDRVNRAARIQRSALLDGSVHVNNFGFVYGDENIQFRSALSPSEKTVLNHIVENYPDGIIVSKKNGVFIAHIQSVSVKGRWLDVNMMIEERLV